MQSLEQSMATRRPTRRFLILGVAAVLILLIGAIAFKAVKTPVDGYLVLGTNWKDHDCEIYVGDRLVGTGCAKVSWAEILGWHGHTPLGIVLADDATWPPPVSSAGLESDSPVPLAVGEATAERLAGEGAAIVHFSGGSPERSGYGSRHRFAHKELLIERGDGTLDQVFCLDAAFTDVLGRTYRVLVPIRVRSPDAEQRQLFTSSSNYATLIERDASGVVAWGQASVPRNGWIHRYSHNWGFEAAEPPAELTDKVVTADLWKPTR